MSEGMRYTWIDGLFVEVTKCGECPFYATECEIGAECRYPRNPANNGDSFSWITNDEIRDDCPLRRVKE